MLGRLPGCRWVWDLLLIPSVVASGLLQCSPVSTPFTQFSQRAGAMGRGGGQTEQDGKETRWGCRALVGEELLGKGWGPGEEQGSWVEGWGPWVEGVPRGEGCGSPGEGEAPGRKAVLGIV